MRSPVKVGLYGALGGLVGAFVTTFILPSGHAHTLSSIWNEHLFLFAGMPVIGFIWGWIGMRSANKDGME